MNAIYADADALKATKSSVAGIDHPTMFVGLMNGGINTNVVPDRLGRSDPCTVHDLLAN
jgi:hypothetical protein